MRSDSGFSSLLFAFASTDAAEECKRRSIAINAVTALRKVQEPPIRKACQAKQRNVLLAAEQESEDCERKAPKPQSVPMNRLPTQCIFCLGKKQHGYPTTHEGVP